MDDDLHIEIEEGGIVMGRVLVARILMPDGQMRDEIATDNGIGGEVDLPTAVGMLAIAQHTLLCDDSE
jgi:hypothetical protein